MTQQIKRLGLLGRAARHKSAISCYLSMPSGELNTDAVVQDALQQGEPCLETRPAPV